MVLIDEYDKPLLDNITDKENGRVCKRSIKEFYGVIKDKVSSNPSGGISYSLVTLNKEIQLSLNGTILNMCEGFYASVIYA